ncbi:unnamed protein product [Cuscuta epithymum]|uniref:Inositol polyphosphate-related phosphatase domain-containing protein n=1 Tax=Cuscuta epithymum TaxID=186058 RepID=A0AAV0FES7_9ASTE|nr:unnamed protein product [Cuscuta epithymum]CAH9133999.1 unnamed protein product [Cuscuta epithymum]
MRDGNSKKTKFSRTKTLVKKWFNIKSKADDFHADDLVSGGVDDERKEKYPERVASTVKKSKTEKTTKRNFERVRQSKIDIDASQVIDVNNYRIFVATWNVAGKSPPSNLSLDNWLHTSPPADIYVLGFQEIVPLNAGNVLGTEDNAPAKKWQALIRKTLNDLPGTSGSCYTPSPIPNPIVEINADFEGSTRERASSFYHRHSFQSSNGMATPPQSKGDRRFSVCDRNSDYEPNGCWDDLSDDEYSPDEYYPVSCNGSMEERDKNPRYCLVLSKQMVGIFMSVWIKSDLRKNVRNLKVSCVGRGLMGYLGNKGSISVSMSLHRTSFCFICSHLTSGQKEGDELRRNSDVMEILKKTRFPRVNGMGDGDSPQSILEHDRIVWFGDLNYRIALSYRTAKTLVEMRNWRALLENDQLRIEQRNGRVFTGWSEGQIFFPPTYKYSSNSDRYAGDDYTHSKRRTPAWCDRILWFGGGLHQISYVRGESRFSDHRPVCSVFLAEVESINHNRFRKSFSYSSSRIEVEELLPRSHLNGEWNYYQ